ncbi:G5 and 3D domain-containing protein [Alkalihalobacillus sp. AL-G]|uniref:G5 and 3D domain-containing protein n=1 Tax=Alkalihalobacillus sp. AL-G TaxID=2926399 RepID=UPI00272DB245|nr:G5 and 3D domain-containing protein [Alkalihalobacillus sp. AL-G]WLD93452.1 ubiquitin-like domain-containing protein [Alkalihalobacillus sp. AL-G]
MMMIRLKAVMTRMFQGKWLLVTIAGLLVLGTAVSVGAYELTKNTVTLSIDGKEKQVKSHAETVKEVLSEHDIAVGSHDIVNPSLDTKVSHKMKISWTPSYQVTINIDGEENELWTTADTVKEFLSSEKIQVTEHDKVKPDLDSSIKDGLTVELHKAFQVNLNDGGKDKKVWTTSITVADLLEQHKIQLSEMDRVEPGMDARVKTGGQVNIIRVEKVTDVVEEAVDYAVVKRKDNNLAEGRERVISQGVEGKVKKHYEVILENGKEVSRELVKTEKISDSKDKIVAVGTKEIQHTVSRGEPSSSSREFYVSSTAYTANCNGCSGITSTGVNLKANPNAKVIAVDPSVIPLGTRVWVEGYGYAVAADTGGAINGNKIDVFFNTKSEAYSWGRRTVLIKILD